jgi:hypothetical protein
VTQLIRDWRAFRSPVFLADRIRRFKDAIAADPFPFSGHGQEKSVPFVKVILVR